MLGSLRLKSYALVVGLNQLFGEIVDRGIAAGIERVGEDKLRATFERSELDFSAAMTEGVERCAVDLANALKDAAPEMLAARRQGRSAIRG